MILFVSWLPRGCIAHGLPLHRRRLQKCSQPRSQLAWIPPGPWTKAKMDPICEEDQATMAGTWSMLTDLQSPLPAIRFPELLPVPPDEGVQKIAAQAKCCPFLVSSWCKPWSERSEEVSMCHAFTYWLARIEAWASASLKCTGPHMKLTHWSSQTDWHAKSWYNFCSHCLLVRVLVGLFLEVWMSSSAEVVPCETTHKISC